MKIIDQCEICNNTNLIPVLNLGQHPLCDDLVKIHDTRITKTYPIEILFCPVCLSAHQKYQIPREELFPQSYHYRAKETQDVLDGMQNLVTSIVESYGNLENKIVLDIGCNDGSLLNYFQSKGAITFGIEPTGACSGIKNHKIINKYFDMQTAKELQGIKFDFITFTNVFAHIDNLEQLIQSLLIISNEHTNIIIENHYLGAILSKQQFDTFYHEHPRTYSLTSFEYIAKRLNKVLQKVEFPKRYGGNIRVFIGGKNHQNAPYIKDENNANGFLEQFSNMDKYIKNWQVNKKDELLRYIHKYGKLSAKAFPGRGAILLKMLELDEQHIEAIYEKPTSKKIGFYAPGTRIPILSDEILFIKNPEIILNIAWHIKDEIKAYLSSKTQSKIIDIL